MKIKGFITAKEIREKHISAREIKALCKRGSLIKIKSGLYRNAFMFLNNQSFIDVCMAIPKGVISSFSALSYYNLTTFIPKEVHVDVPSLGRTRKILYPPTKQYQVSRKQLENNVKVVKSGKYSFRIYEVEKVVCDAVKFRNKIGLDITKEVIRETLKNPGINLPKVFKIAKERRVLNKLKEILNFIN